MSLSDFNMRATEELIAEVKKRPLLWNKNVENYNNRPSMHAEWKSLETVLNKDKDLIKQKWRNLRDQFLRELKKTNIPQDCDVIMDYYKGRWIYFEDLLFLKDYTTEKKKKSTSNDSGDVDEITYEEIKEEFIFEEPTSNPSIEPEEHNVLDDQSVVEPNVEVVVWPQKINEEQREIKRKRETDRLGQSKKFAVEDDEDIDEDLYFVKSLVPFLRRLNPVRKLIVRNEIQSLLIKEMLCEKCRVNGPQSMCKCDGTS